MLRVFSLLLLLLCGCRSSGAPDATSPFDAGVPRPDGPTFGEVSWWHLSLPAGLALQQGEAGILVGPDGTIVLVDIGNVRHDNQVRAAINQLNTKWLTPERGYARTRAPLEVDWILLTHFHNDHIGAFGPLTTGETPITINHGVIHRGFVDVGGGLSASEFATLCTALQGPSAMGNVPLCAGNSVSPCTVGSDSAPASSCPGLLLGNLATTGDEGQPSFIDLGGGAKLRILGADNFVLKGSTPVMGAPFGVATFDEENGRSIIGLVEHGPFRLLFAGDLIGTAPDVESFVVATAPEVFGTVGIDFTHANHHARNTSSNANWVNASAPNDGRTRSAFSGFNITYPDAPNQDVVNAWTDNGRLGFGKLWVTDRGPAGGSGAGLVDLDATIHLQTVEGGGFYFVEDLVAPAVRK